jgi:gamma-glutamyl:cysteine ligase YbdK (ATP-grasp superfamily)
MGQRIDRDVFDEEDYARFRQRLVDCLAILSDLLDRPGFGVGPASVGAELELFLVDTAARPLRRNQEVCAATADPRVTLELDRFNMELNSSPTGLAGHPFTGLGDELSLLLGRVGEAAKTYGGRLTAVGILPTLRRSDLGLDVITDAPRYVALNNGLRRLRQDTFRIRIDGPEPLELLSDDVAVEGANTSFQVHLRVNPADFTRTYNAVQLASAPAVALAANSPTFLGHHLWDETRIALCKQSIDDRNGREPRRRLARVALGTGWLREGPLELFAESVRLHQPLLPVLGDRDPSDIGGPGQGPALEELRLHQGTVWRWNRAIYDPAAGGHLRIEMRALPAGPTVIDMMANAAFLLGLSLWLARQDERWTYVLSFERAEHNFYQAAQHGLAAQLTWPVGGQVRVIPAAQLLVDLLPHARDGLVGGGVAVDEADRLLDVISSRVTTGQTGAVWQRTVLAHAEQRLPRDSALAAMLKQYLACAAGEQPVHTWPTEAVSTTGA